MAFKKRLAEQGVLSEEEAKKYLKENELTKKCAICGHINKFTDDYCIKCKRPLNREELIQKENEMENRVKSMEEMIKQLSFKILKED